MPLSRLYAIVSVSPLRTVTESPNACETSVSAELAPRARAACSTCSATESSASRVSGKRVAGGAATGSVIRPLIGGHELARLGIGAATLAGRFELVPSLLV